MNLLVLHLSDMHFGEKYCSLHEITTAITNSLRESIKNVDYVLIIVSGDLTYSGKKTECIQASKFLRGLKKSIENQYEIEDVQFAIVPGNHDVDYDLGNMSRVDLENIETEGLYEDRIKDELLKMNQFFVLSKIFDCFSSPSVVCQRHVVYDNKTVQINLINTAIFSSLSEDQGFHYIPDSDISLLSEQNNSDFVISVMHHPHHWYSSRCKKKLEQALYSRSDIIFVGHEHYESIMKIEHEEASVNVFAAGKLADQGDWTDSEIHVGLLNLDNREYKNKTYHWNSISKIYEVSDDEDTILSRNRFNKLGLSLKNDFSNELEEDKYLISNNVLDYFVFPLLTEEYCNEDNGQIPRELDSMESFFDSLSNKEKIVISGGSDTGKSVLARAIYFELAARRITLFINGAEVGANPEWTIREAFENAYSSDKSAYEAFRQTSPEDLAIVIDDVDAIDINREDSFVSYISERFGIIVETCQAEIDIDIKTRLKKRANNRSFTFYKINHFYSNKRRELVEKIVNKLCDNDYERKNHIISVLCDVLTKQKYLYSWSPDFIVQFVKYYCNNIGEALQNDGSVFSKVFESNLTQLIKPHARELSVDKVIMVLDKLAYGIYIDSNYPISIADIDRIIQSYNDDYGAKIDTLEFVKLLVDAKVMKKVEAGFVFYDRNYLSYFIAREIKRRYLENGDREQLNRVMNYSYSGLNADILLFITYITDNINIIRMIMEQGDSSVSEWEEFNLREIDIPFLVYPVEQIVKPFDEKEREEIENNRIQQEKNEVKKMSVANDETIFNEESEELNFIQMLIRSISLMIILSRTLPCFEHMMKKEDKERCVDILYRMPLKIFEAWAKDLDSVSSELIADIKEFHENEYRKEKPQKHPLDDNEALSILKWEATSLLLDLLSAVMNNATRVTTNDFLDAFDYKQLPTYGLEHLISLGVRDDVQGFGQEAERIYLDEKQSLTKTMTRRVARHFMVNSKRIKQPDIQRLNAKLFNDNLQYSRLLIEQKRNKDKL